MVMKENEVNSKLNMKKLMSKVDNRFVLAVASARRARQILEGATPLVAKVFEEKPNITALREIQEDKIDIYIEEG